MCWGGGRVGYLCGSMIREGGERGGGEVREGRGSEMREGGR